jgi:hypothetical protein
MSDRYDYTNDQFLRFIMEDDPHPVVAGGAMPEGAPTPYMPSIDEFVEGAQFAAEANRELAEARARVSGDRARMLFGEREAQQ